MTLWGLVALLGGVGAVCRYLVDRMVSGMWGRSVPLGTMVVNITGSAFAGYFLGSTSYLSHTPTLVALVLTGFLGGYTTASTLSFEIVELLHERRIVSAAVATFGTMILSIGFGTLGLLIGLA